jgi:uncharacterized protein
MNQYFPFLAALAVFATASALPGQETTPGRALVSTVGSAEIRVVPDLADLVFQVEVRNANLSKARKDQAERATKVLAALRSAGVAERDLQTSQVDIVPHYDNRENEAAAPFGPEGRRPQESPTARFYSVSQYISCTLRDVRKIPSVTADAVLAGVTGTQGATLRSTELRKYRDQARANAVKAAKEKAVALAGELGAKVGRPYSISENSYYEGNRMLNSAPVYQGSAAAPGGSDSAESTFVPGTISVGANVSVSFLLE